MNELTIKLNGKWTIIDLWENPTIEEMKQMFDDIIIAFYN